MHRKAPLTCSYVVHRVLSVAASPADDGSDVCFYFNLLSSLCPQGTSVLSPVLHIGSVIILAVMIYKKSAVQLFEKHPCLYILAFGFVSAKITNKLVVSSDNCCPS